MTGSPETHGQQALRELIVAHRLPADYERTVARFHVPLAAALAERQRHHRRTLVVGLCGSQGSGKSTLAAFLQRLLADRHGLDTAVLSLDDLYLTRAGRQRLADEVHPLLRTRGVPGTHDVALGVSVIRALCSAGPDARTAIPRFDKGTDERAAPQAWTRWHGRPALVLFEGWCVGVQPQADGALVEPLNALEREEDADGRWRRFVNAQLAGPYRELFALVDSLLLLQAPGFDCVYRWRALQEARLRDALAAGGSVSASARAMSDTELERFIMHYERLTRHALATMPGQADAVMALDAGHGVRSLRLR